MLKKKLVELYQQNIKQMIYMMDILKQMNANPENKYETTFKETAKIMVSNKDIAQKIEVKETSKDVDIYRLYNR